MSRRILIHPALIVVAAGCLAVILAACGGATPATGAETKPPAVDDLLNSPLPTPVVLGPLTLQPGSGGMRGQIVASPQEWQGQSVTVYLAAYYEGTAEQGGFYMLDPVHAPATVPDSSGAFQLGNVPPARYVVVIGVDVENALVIRQDDKPQVFTVEADEVLDLGPISLP